MSNKLLFVSYAHPDRERVRPLVALLDQRLCTMNSAVFWDERLAVGAPISEAVAKLLSEAACVLVVWSKHSVTGQWVHGECETARKDLRLVPVLLDSDAVIPPPFNALKHCDLTAWAGDDSPALVPVWNSVLNLMQRGGGASYYGTLAENPWVIKEVTTASTELRDLAGRFRSINEVLVADCASPILRPGKIVDAGALAGDSMRHASRRSDGRGNSIRLIDASRPAARDTCPALVV